MREVSLNPKWPALGIIFLLTPQEDLKVLSADGVLTSEFLDELKVEKPEILQSLRKKYAGVPVPWSNAVEITSARNKPRGISESRWGAILQRLDVLLHEERSHLLKMIAYDWSLEEVFGCHRFAPDVRRDGMGLLMLLPGVEIAEINPRGAFLRNMGGAITTYPVGSMSCVAAERSTLMEIV
jgi:hypothetical protein